MLYPSHHQRLDCQLGPGGAERSYAAEGLEELAEALVVEGIQQASDLKRGGVKSFARLGGWSLALEPFGVELGTFGVELETIRAVEVSREAD